MSIPRFDIVNVIMISDSVSIQITYRCICYKYTLTQVSTKVNPKLSKITPLY